MWRSWEVVNKMKKAKFIDFQKIFSTPFCKKGLGQPAKSSLMSGLALVSICEIDVTSFSEMEGVLNGYVTNPNRTPTLPPNPNRNPNSNLNQINEKIQKETTLEIDQITKCQCRRLYLII